MRGLAAVFFAGLVLAACDMPDPSPAPHHAWQNSLTGTRITNVTTSSDVGQADPASLAKIQRSGTTTGGLGGG